MATLRNRIESNLEAFGLLVCRHRLKTLLLVGLLVAGLASQLPRVTFDTSTESFFRPGDPAMVDYNAFREQFGRDELIVIAVKPPEVFDAAFLEKLRAFQLALEQEVPFIDEVTSLLTIRNTRGRGDELVVEDLVREIPRTQVAMAALKHRVLTSPLYPNFIISEDGRLTTVLIETLAYSPQGTDGDLLGGFQALDAPAADGAVPQRILLSDAENSAVVAAVEKVMARFRGADFPLFLAGSPVVTHTLKRAMQSNMQRFIALAVLAIGLLLGLLFRRVSGVVLPLLVVLLSLVSTVALMAIFDVAFKLPQMILPSFLLAVGVGASVHVLAIFFRAYQSHGDKTRAIAYTLGHSGLPIVMTSITTAAGLFSFLTAALGSVADLGLFAGLGVLLSLVYTLAMLPALLSLLPIRPHVGRAPQDGLTRVERLLVAVGDLATGRPWTVVLASAVLVAVGVAGLTQLRFSHNTLKWFPPSMEVRRSTDLIDKELKGTVSVELVIDTGRENGLYEPAVLNGLEQVARFAEAYRHADGRTFVGKTNSVAVVVKEIHRALNEDRAAFYTIPQDRKLIAQELLLFENSGNDDLESLVDSRFSKARLTVKVPWDDAAAYVAFVAALQAEGERVFTDTAQVTTTGLLKLFTEALHRLMWSMVTSYTVAIVVITVLMMLLIGSFRIGLLSMIPNLTPILVTLGFMGWADLPLDAFTLLVGSIALGLAVDDTIHFFHNYRRYFQQTGNSREAVRETLLGSGRAMVITTLVLVIGFWLFMFASLNNLFNFGLLTGMTLCLALLADFLLAPAMLELVVRTGPGRRIAERWGRT